VIPRGAVEVDERRRPERVKRLPREVREKQILDAAVRVFSAHGYHNASMDEISDVAGVSKPMIYSYLGSKEDLFGACIRREATRLLDAVTGGIRVELPPDMQLWHGLAAFFRFVGEHRESWRVLHRQATSQGGPLRDEVVTMRDRAIALVDTLLVRNAVKHGLDEEATRATKALAAALVGSAESLADWWLDHPDISDKTLASWLMNLVWMGFGDLVEGTTWIPSETW
jgi:AcrR family transcriptional regulator